MRYLGWKTDAVAGGTSYDEFVGAPLAGAFPAPDVIVPVTNGQAAPGNRPLDRNTDVINQRGNSAPVSFAAAPSMTFESRAWTKLMRDVLRKAMAGTIANSGVAPAPIESTVQMLKSGLGDSMPAINPTLVREGQVDQMVGAVFSSAEFNFPAEGEGTINASLMAKYHEVETIGEAVGLPTPAGGHPAGYRDAYMLRDVVAMTGAAAVEIDCLGGFGFTIDNNMVDDIRVTHCAGRNIAETVLDTITHRLWYPDRHRPGAQTVTGRLDFGETRPDRELRRILAATEKLVVELAAGPLTPATVPPADEMIRLVFWNIGYTGGGAEPLAREGEQLSSYEFTAYVDDVTGKDLEAVLVGIAAAT